MQLSINCHSKQPAQSGFHLCHATSLSSFKIHRNSDFSPIKSSNRTHHVCRTHPITFQKQQHDQQSSPPPRQRRSSPPAGVASRCEAVDLLLRIEEDGSFANRVDKTPDKRQYKTSTIDKADRRFITLLVNGATKYKRRLDWIINQLYPEGDANDGGMETAFRQVLRLALFDMIELGTPSHVINVWVDVSRIMVGERVARLCNALLRKCDRMWQADALPSPPLPPNLLELDINVVDVDDLKKLARMLGVCYSHPDWLIKKWLRSFGVEGTVRLLEHNNAIPEYSARVLDGTDINELLDWMESQGGDAVRSEYLPDDFICVASGMQKLLGDGIINRQIQVQDIAAGLVVVAALDPQPGDEILDCCAAPGGKALFAASRMKGRGRLVAVDLHKNRLLALQKSAEAQGLSAIIETIASDFVDLVPRFKESFDKVLVDAPCSGSGVIAKRADLRWRKSPQDIEELVVLQDRLLDAAAQAVKLGGVLVYSTCSIEHEENRGRVDAFIQRHKGEFVLEGINSDEDMKVPRKCLDTFDGKCLTMLPHITGTDGSFAARLRKRRSRG